MSATSARLEILKASLAKKKGQFDSKLSDHYATVKQANGQPLNDKRNGASTLSKWDKQEAALRVLAEGIKKTERAIEREESAIALARSVELPKPIRELIGSGVIKQWRRNPTFFFVDGVDHGRIVWRPELNDVAHRYVSNIPKDQYARFRDVFNGLRSDLRTVKESLSAQNPTTP